MVARRAVVAVTAALACAGVLVSCYVHHDHDHSGCDYVVTRCATVCDTYCDFWGCYPVCYDTCFDDCVVAPPAPPAVPVEGAAPPPAVTDAAAPSGSTNDGGAPLCASCLVNDDCNAGAFCLVPGGGDAGVDAAAPGFCGAPCTVSGDAASCPEGFTCSSIGSGLQCVPAAGRCP